MDHVFHQLIHQVEIEIEIWRECRIAVNAMAATADVVTVYALNQERNVTIVFLSDEVTVKTLTRQIRHQ